MMSLVFWTQSVSVVFYPPVFFHNSALRVTRKMNKFDKQTFLGLNSNVCFSTRLPYSFKHLSHLTSQHSARENQLLWSLLRSLKQHGGQARSFLPSSTFLTLSKLYTNVYYWSSKTQVTVRWMHYWVNCIGANTAKSCDLLSPRENEWQNPCGILSTVMSPYLMFTTDVIVTSS